jgi:hypothetical protein
LKPKDVETDFWITLTGCKRALYGKLDLVTEDELLIDHKTSSKTWKQVQSSRYHKPGELDMQMSIYHGGYQNKYKTWPKACELHRAVLSVPEIERIDVTYTIDEVQKQFDTKIKPTIQKIETAWESGTFSCTCGNHKDTPATAARPLMINGAAAGTTDVTPPEETLIDKINKKSKKVREQQTMQHPPLDLTVLDEVPF